jgi:hypothetical protein
VTGNNSSRRHFLCSDFCFVLSAVASKAALCSRSKSSKNGLFFILPSQSNSYLRRSDLAFLLSNTITSSMAGNDGLPILGGLVPTGTVTAALIAFAVARLALLQFSLSALFVTANCRNQPANADLIQWELPYGVPGALQGKPSVTAFRGRPRRQIYRIRQSVGAPLPRTLIRFTERWLGRLSSNRRSSNRREVPLLWSLILSRSLAIPPTTRPSTCSIVVQDCDRIRTKPSEALRTYLASPHTSVSDYGPLLEQRNLATIGRTAI